MTDRDLGPMPRSPRKWVRNIAKHGHHLHCPMNDADESVACAVGCLCRELDEDDYAVESERRYDAWKNGDYADQEEP